MCVGIARVPASELCSIVTLIGAIPAKHNVAESEASSQHRRKLAWVQIFAAHDTVDIRDRDLSAPRFFYFFNCDVLFAHVLAPTRVDPLVQ